MQWGKSFIRKDELSSIWPSIFSFLSSKILMKLGYLGIYCEDNQQLQAGPAYKSSKTSPITIISIINKNV